MLKYILVNALKPAWFLSSGFTVDYFHITFKIEESIRPLKSAFQLENVTGMQKYHQKFKNW